MRKRIVFIILTLAFILSLYPVQMRSYAADPKPGYNYVASVKSKKARFHVFSCEWAKKINPANAVYFKTREEAIQQGYTPCHVCNP